MLQGSTGNSFILKPDNQFSSLILIEHHISTIYLTIIAMKDKIVAAMKTFQSCKAHSTVTPPGLAP